jgi:UDP-GlcNAc:undecaprenyl-phosphate GlcNAc-1-phosphate transferase
MPADAHYLALAAAVSVIIVFGYLDDRFTLRSRYKFVGQCIAAGIFLAAYGGLPQFPFVPLDSAPDWVMLLWTFVFLVGVTNAVNLSDGLDGLAAGNSLLTIGLLAVFAAQIGRFDYVVMALAMAGGLLGFLRFNTHPARLFMGDTGSQFLGFTAAALTVLILQGEAAPVSPLVPVLAFGLPILDTLSVMAIRLLKGRPVFRADRSHLHHQLLRLGFRHYEVVALMYALQAVAVVLAFVLRYQPDFVLLLAYGAYAAMVLGAILLGRVLGRVLGWHAHDRGPTANPAERRNLWLRKFEWYHRHTAKVLAVGVAGMFLAGAAFSAGRPSPIADLALVTAAALGVAAIWFRRQPEFVGRLVAFVVTAFVVYGFLLETDARPVANLLVDAYLVTLAALLMLAIRMTRKTQFHLDTQDFLVLFIVAVVPFLPIGQFDDLLVARVTLRALVLLYACEYIVTKGGGTRWLLSVVGIASLAFIGLSGWEFQ